MKLEKDSVFSVVLQKDQQGQDVLEVRFSGAEGNGGIVQFRDFDYSSFLEDVRKHFNGKE